MSDEQSGAFEQEYFKRWFWLDWANKSFSVLKWSGIYRYLLPTGYYLHKPTFLLRRFTPAVAIVAKQAQGV